MKINGNSKRPNRLINEKSPYLLQHAYNPVDWYPWSPETFDKAKKEDKPIFLSIGYSTCHWCHVMAHESFEDPKIAKMMNDTFICIKVDREERPEIDNIYMAVCQIMTRSGGWPLTIVMTPDKRPFFASTYIPKKSRFGKPGMIELIPKIKDVWITRRDEIQKSADSIISSIKNNSFNSPGDPLDESTLNDAYLGLFQRFDKKYGGFSIAPKFPSPHLLYFLLRFWKRTNEKNALEMVEKTLSSMRDGGIYDHIGFGFHRYSTDHTWFLPHFEKMLYDQALLAMAYIEVYQATGKKEYAFVAKEIFEYVLRDMTDTEGGFYSAEDADSQGVEGKFYIWTKKEVEEVLGPKEAEIIIKAFEISKVGNFLEESTGNVTGKNIFHLEKPLAEISSELNMKEEDLSKLIEDSRKKLFSYRKKRVHPHKDDKILTDWNGLMVAALAKGAQVFDELGYAESAKRATDLILKKMRNSDGRLLHRYREGQADILAYLDDYAFLIWGLLELYEVTFEVDYLKTALGLNKDLIDHFWDEDLGGFYFTADDGEDLLIRTKEAYDAAIPSGNSVAMLNLLRLSRITSNSDLEEMAMKLMQAFSNEIKNSPSAYTNFLCAVDFGIGPSYEVVISGDTRSDDTKKMLLAIRSRFIPKKVIILRPVEDAEEIDSITGFTEYQNSIEGKATAYVCQNHACKSPTTDVDEMLELLR